MPGDEDNPDPVAHVEVKLFGPPVLRHAGRVARLPPNDAALLAVLAIDGPTSRQAMADWLWPDAGETARSNLRQRLSRWRASFGLVLQGTAQDLLALPAGVTVDLHQLEARLAVDATAGSQPLLAGLAYDHNPRLALWVAQAREQWRSKRGALLGDAASRLEREGRLADALAVAAEIVAGEPLAEHAHRRVMRLHYLRGDRGAALAAFDACTRRLAEDLGLRPSDETRELARTIERSARPPTRATAPTPPPVALMRPPVLIGRHAEWQMLSEAALGSRIVVALGEAGIGKTRLLGDFAVSRGHSLRVSARPGDADVPYEFLARLLREGQVERGMAHEPWVLHEFARFLPELGPPPTGRLEPVRLRRAVRLALRQWRAAGTATLLADDLHFADEASLELLLPCFADAADGWCLLLAVRSNEVPHVLARWLALQAGARDSEVVELRLGPFDASAVALLIDSLQLDALAAPDDAASLTRYTGGNPWFVMQTLSATLAHPQAPNPSDHQTRDTRTWVLAGQISQLIERRLSGLSDRAVQLIRVAALAGSDFDPRLAADALGCPLLALTEAWAELERLGVIRGGVFSHDLWLEVARRQLPPAIARGLHGRLAELLELRSASPARIAAHWFAAENWRRAAPHFRSAAASAFGASRPAEQLAWLDRAATCFDRAGDRAAAFQCGLAAIGALFTIEPGVEVERRMRALLDSAVGEDERLDALLVQCKQLLSDSDGARAIGPAREAFGLAQRIGPLGRQAAAAGWLGLAQSIAGESPATTLGLFEAHAEVVANIADPQVRLDFFGAHAYALNNASRPQDAIAPTQAALGLAERLGDLNEAMVQATNLALMLSSCGRRDASLAAYDEALSLWRRLGEPGGVSAAALHMHAGSLSASAGRYREALQRLQWALGVFRTGRESLWTLLTEHRIAGIYIALGQPARARQMFSAMPATTPAGTRLARVKFECLADGLAQPAVHARLATALAVFAADVNAMERIGGQLLLSSVGDEAAAVERCRAAVAEAQAIGTLPLIRHAQIRLADALRRAGRHAAAAEAAAGAVASIDPSDDGIFFDLTVPEFWWLAWQAFDAAGQDAHARLALRRGVAFVRCAIEAGVPEEFASSYAHRNPVIAGLLMAAAGPTPTT